MQVSKQGLDPKLERELFQAFCQLIVDIRSEGEASQVMHELLSETERIAITKRLWISILLDKGTRYDDIKQTVKVSSATIASVQNRMGQIGMQLAIAKVKINLTADTWADKLSGFFFPFKSRK